jgi:hypothetical protein
MDWVGLACFPLWSLFIIGIVLFLRHMRLHPPKQKRTAYQDCAPEIYIIDDDWD